MIIFIKKIKTKEGINAFDNEKVKKSIPADYKITNQEPIITLTANNILIAYRCEKIEKPVTAEAAPKEIKAAKAALANSASKATAASKEKAKPNKAAEKKAPAKK